MKANTDKVNCKYCGSSYHYTTFCQSRPRKTLKHSKKPMAKEALVTRRKRIKTFHKWIEANPPDENGNWICYLRISRLCLKRLSRPLLNLEHKRPRSKHPELKYDIHNIAPSCYACNRMKGSRELEELVKIWPRLQIYIDK